MTLAHPTRAAVVILAVATIVFLATVAFVLSGASQSFDQSVVLLFRDAGDVSDAWGPDWFEEAAAEFTALGGYTILTVVGLIAVSMLLLLRKTGAAVFLVAAVLSGTVVSTVLKGLFARPRPDIVDHLDRVFTASFPSGHATIGMLAWLTLAAILIRFVRYGTLRVFIVATAVFLGIAIGVSRVYLGVHWPTDVVAGWCLGIAWACICWLVANHITADQRVPVTLGTTSAAERTPPREAGAGTD